MNRFKVKIDDIQERVKVPKGVRLLVRKCCKAVLFEEHKENFENVKIVFAENQMLDRLSGKNLAQEKNELFVRQPIENNSDVGEYLGEVYISLEKAMQQSQAYNNSFEAEVVHLTAHAVFLLLGYKNRSVFEKDVLLDKENRIVQMLGMTYHNHI
ncbi:MAG: rRNA maturation RNase YbeY [Ruminococcus sp.]|nr:rRNA maturation RNase YbeY [Ruminococcus sp.]